MHTMTISHFKSHALSVLKEIAQTKEGSTHADQAASFSIDLATSSRGAS